MSALTVMPAAIRAEHEAAQASARDAVAHAIRAGELLLETKAGLAHGAFGSWLAANISFSDRTARGYMRLAGLDEGKRQRVADLSLRNALKLLAEPTGDPAPALVAETEKQMRARCHAKLKRWLDAGLVGDDVLKFTAADTSPAEARDWIEVLSPSRFFNIDPELCSPLHLETCAEAIKHQRYVFQETYLSLHAIAGLQQPPLLSHAAEVQLLAERLFGKILLYWYGPDWKHPREDGGFDPDAWLARCAADAAKTLADCRTREATP